MEDVDELILARLRVYDDLAETTFTVDLKDVVALMHRRSEPGKRRPKIIALLNERLLERYPQLALSGLATLLAWELTGDEKYAKWQEDFNAAMKEYSAAKEPAEKRKASQRYQKIYRERSKLINQERTGFVWLFVQK